MRTNKRVNSVYVIKEIQRYLENKLEANISQVSHDLGINRRTATKYLKLLEWIHTRPDIFERKSRKAQRIFTVINEQTLHTFEHDEQGKLEYAQTQKLMLKNDLEFCIPKALAEIIHIANSLDLSRKILEDAAILYRTIFGHLLNSLSLTKKMILKDLVPAVVYYICKEHRIKLTLDKLAHASNMPEEDIEDAIKLLNRMVPLLLHQKGEFGIGVVSDSQKIWPSKRVDIRR